MTEIRHRHIGDRLAFDFEVLRKGAPYPIPDAVLSFAAIDPSGATIDGLAAWLTGEDSHVVRAVIEAGATTAPGKHELQLRIEAPSLAETVRGRVHVNLERSAEFSA